MAHIRTFAELKELPPTKAEWRLIDAAQAGEPCVLGDGTLPPEGPPTPERHIRAAVLRYLILGGCDACRVDDIGVWLVGGHITDTLDLDFTTARGAVRISKSRFEHRIDADQFCCRMLALDGCQIPSLFAQAIETNGSIFLDRIQIDGMINFNSAEIRGPIICRHALLGTTSNVSFNAQGANVKGSVFFDRTVFKSSVKLINSRISSQLSCDGANLESKTGWALDLQQAEISSGIFLRPAPQDDETKQATPFIAKGGVYLESACIGGIYSKGIVLSANKEQQALRAKNLTVNGVADLEGCTIKGTTDFTGAKITGDLSCKESTFKNEDGDAFIARRMQVAQSFIWRKDATATGKVILDGAHAAELDDNPQHWPDAAHLSLDGFTYDRIAEYTDYSPARKDWLHNGSHTDGKFFPQPYSQYAKFLRDTGHDSEARKVLLTRETLVRDHERSELNGFNLVKRTAGDWLQKVVVGYGHDPFRSIWWLFGLIFIAMIPACFAWNEGSFAPNSGPVLVSQGWTNLHTEAPNPAKIWSGDMVPKGWTPEGVDTTDWDETQLADAWKNSAPGRDWETFNSVAYAADIVIPLINFGQTEAWAPSTTRGWWGWHLWWMRWGFTVFGWIVTALGAAAITGIIRRE